MARNKNIMRTSKGVVVDGQFHETPATPSGPKYQHTGCDMARAATKEKNVGDVPITRGMKRQTTGAIHPYAHGQAIDDEPMAKNFNTGRSVPIHDGMGTSMKGEPHTRGIVAHVGDASKHLRAAGRLSASAAQLSKAEGFDHSLVGHRIGKQQLPSNKRRLDR